MIRTYCNFLRAFVLFIYNSINSCAGEARVPWQCGVHPECARPRGRVHPYTTAVVPHEQGGNRYQHLSA